MSANLPDELNRPRGIGDLARWLQEHGEQISYSTLYRWAKEGLLPVRRVGRMTSTAAAYYAVRTPEVEGAG